MSRASVDSGSGKAAAAAVAATMIPPGACLALGTGSTVEASLPMLADIPGLVATPTSAAIAQRAQSAGLKLIPLRRGYDFYLDGADQVAPNGDVVKGSWGAHVREKTLAVLAKQRILICDEGKLVDKLAGPVPVAVIPFFAGLYTDSAPRIDENGLAIVDAAAGEIIESGAEWDEWMRMQPGVVLTGLFPAGFVQAIIIGHGDGTTSIHAGAR